MAQRQEDFVAPFQATEEEYLARYAWETEYRYEYINGYVHMMAGGTVNHNTIVENCRDALRDALKGKESYCRAKGTDTKVVSHDPRKNYFYPDCTVICDPIDLETTNPYHIYQAPVMVVEVLSRSTAKEDRGAKMKSYTKTPSIQAYIIIHAGSVTVEVYRRNEEGELYPNVTLYGAGESIEFDFLGISIDVDALYEHVVLGQE